MTKSDLCLDGGPRHSWHSTGMDIVENRCVYTADMIGTTYPERRRCVDCLKVSCAEAGHPLVDWFGPGSLTRLTSMQCKCQAVKA